MKTIYNLLRTIFSRTTINNQYYNTDKFIDEDIRLNLGKLLTAQIDLNKTINQAEFSVFSQWGDDGIIQYIIQKVGLDDGYFIEFGVENYRESNTRFLMMNNNWSGLVMDGSQQHIHTIVNSEYYWKYDLNAKCQFITAENINEIIESSIENRNVDLLHIDIDGNDYWIWKAIKVIKPIIVIVEYNSVFGIERAITVPYKSDFDRTTAHYSNLYAGASLLALDSLAKEKEYSLIGCNSAGNNAYFIRNDYMNFFKPLTVNEAYKLSKFREARGTDGVLFFPYNSERLSIIKGMPVYNVLLNEMELI